MKYGEAAAELDSILRKIEEGHVDIDELSDRVQRAAELIRVCREKLEATEVRVRKVVADIASAPAGAEQDASEDEVVSDRESMAESKGNGVNDGIRSEGRPRP